MLWTPFLAGIAIGLFVVAPTLFCVFCWVVTRRGG